jgi:hypothetical protein
VDRGAQLGQELLQLRVLRRGRGEGGRSGDDRPAVPWRWDVADEADLVQVGLRAARASGCEHEARDSSGRFLRYLGRKVLPHLIQVHTPSASSLDGAGKDQKTHESGCSAIVDTVAEVLEAIEHCTSPRWSLSMSDPPTPASSKVKTLLGERPSHGARTFKLDRLDLAVLVGPAFSKSHVARHDLTATAGGKE